MDQTTDFSLDLSVSSSRTALLYLCFYFLLSLSFLFWHLLCQTLTLPCLCILYQYITSTPFCSNPPRFCAVFVSWVLPREGVFAKWLAMCHFLFFTCHRKMCESNAEECCRWMENYCCKFQRFITVIRVYEWSQAKHFSLCGVLFLFMVCFKIIYKLKFVQGCLKQKTSLRI